MKTIAIINLKGGVGKSVTACNLAAELAHAHLSVLVVDLDKQANTTKFFECLDYEESIVGDLLTGDVDDPAEVVTRTKFTGISLLPCNMKMLRANQRVLIDSTRPQQTRLREALQKLEQQYSVAILDCPPDLDMGSVNALCAADWVIIPVDCDEWAVDGLDEIVDQMKVLREYYNPRMQLMGVLMTKYQPTKYARWVAEEVNLKKLPLMHSVIRYTVRVKEAKAEHKPLREYDRRSTAAHDYKDLAKEVLQHLGVSDVDTKERRYDQEEIH